MREGAFLYAKCPHFRCFFQGSGEKTPRVSVVALDGLWYNKAYKPHRAGTLDRTEGWLVRHVRRLLLDGLWNARDLGGYAVAGGGRTRFGVFVRSEAPCGLPETTVRALWNYGIRATADLRSRQETSLRPSDLLGTMDCHNCPQGGRAETFSTSEAVDWQKIYIQRTEDNQPWIRQVLELAAAQEGGLLIHCTTGKDRTGMISCFLLSIAGVSREDIAADYCVSEVYLEPVFDAMRRGALPFRPGDDSAYDDSIFHTPASAMLGLQDALTARYGSVVEYLRAAGVSQAVMDAIRAKFVEP